jgi:hypothetical protein
VIFEHALLQVRAGEEAEFETAIAEANPRLSTFQGFLGIEDRPAESDSANRIAIRNDVTCSTAFMTLCRQLDISENFCD